MKRIALALLGLTACAGDSTRVREPSTLEGYQLFTELSVDDGELAFAERLKSGEILVRAYPNFIGLYDTTGTLINRIGRPGAGPGEFRQLGWAGAGGSDSIWAYDIQLRRLSLFNERGGAVAQWNIRGTRFPNVAARLSNGTFLFVDPQMPMPLNRGGLTIDSVNILAFRVADSVPTVVTRRPWRVLFRDRESPTLIAQPLSPSGFVAGADSTFFVAHGSSPTVEELSVRGVRIGTTVPSIDARPLTDADRSAARSLAKKKSAFQGMSRLHEQVPLPANRPLIEGLVAGADRLWIALDASGGSIGVTWLSLRPGASSAHSLRAPPGMTILQAGFDWLLVRETLRGGGEVVRLYTEVPASRPPIDEP